MIVSSVPAALDTPRERRRIGEELIDALVEIHAVDWRAAGLEGFGKPTGYLERQLRRFGGLWELNKTREIPAVERVGKWLAENLPESGAGDDRARRLPPGQHDLRRRRPRAPGGGARLGDGDDRRPARGPRLPVHDVDRGRATREGGMREHLGKVTRARGLPHARRADRALRGALGPLDAATSAGTRRSRCGRPSCSWRATTSARSPARPTIRICKQFGEGVLELAARGGARRWPDGVD